MSRWGDIEAPAGLKTPSLCLFRKFSPLARNTAIGFGGY